MYRTKKKYCKGFFNGEKNDQWIEVYLDKTGDMFSLNICIKTFYGCTSSHMIKKATWDDFDKLDSIFAKLNDDDVAYCCDV